MPSNVDAEFLFPAPSLPPSILSPYHWPGISPDSTQALKDVLKDNHERWHIFFNDKGYHNHAMHHAIAIWSLGVDGAVITAGYELHSKEQRPAFESPEPITEANFEKHLGDERFYDAYVNFYTTHARKHGIDKTLEVFIFSKKYNTGSAEMLSRFLSGLLHPMIHSGYGAEFSLPGMLVEGLASTSVHHADVSKLLPQAFFDSIYATTSSTSPGSPGFIAGVTGTIRNVASYIVPSMASAAQQGHNIHALTILARVAADAKLTLPNDLDELRLVENTIADHSDLIRKYVMEWTIDLSQPGEINRKVEELSWMVVVIYGIAGWTWAQQVKQGKKGPFNADFFFVHLVTSSAFIPSILARISESPHSQILLLRSYLAVALSVYVSRSKPKFDIAAFFKSPTATAYPLPIHSLPTPHKDALPGKTAIQARVPDPWLPLVQTSIVHPDSHLPKAVRSLASLGSKFGSIVAGTFGSPESSSGQGSIKTELPGVEHLDGTLFIRVAGLTVARMGRVGQGEAAHQWDRDGFYEDPKVAEEARLKMQENPVD